MQVSEKIDWLSITFKSSPKLSEILLPYIDHSLVQIKSPIPIYTTAYEVMPYKAKVLIGGERHGIHMIYSGSTLDRLRALEVSMQELYNLTVKHNGKISRIDLAIDVLDNRAFTPAALMRRFDAGKCVTQFVGSKFIGEDKKVETFYIGKLNNRKRKFRVYDKAVEQGLIDKYWTRIEYEKRNKAHMTAKAIFDNDQSLRGIIKGAVDFPDWKLYQKILSCDVAKIPRVTHQDSTWSDKLAWLLTTYPRAIANVMIEEYNDKLSEFEIDKSDVLNTFAAALSAEIRMAQLRGDLPLSTHENDE